MIRSATVRLINDAGEQLGIMAREKAIDLARGKTLDLVEVSPNSNPPVCKIMDYGKHLYHQKKIETKHRKSQKKTTMKGVRMGFKTGDHDLSTKAVQAKKFLEAGNGVKVTLMFKGREIMYSELAKEKLKKFYEIVKDCAQIEDGPSLHGNMLIMILTPIK